VVSTAATRNSGLPTPFTRHDAAPASQPRHPLVLVLQLLADGSPPQLCWLQLHEQPLPDCLRDALRRPLPQLAPHQRHGGVHQVLDDGVHVTAVVAHLSELGGLNLWWRGRGVVAGAGGGSRWMACGGAWAGGWGCGREAVECSCRSVIRFLAEGWRSTARQCVHACALYTWMWGDGVRPRVWRYGYVRAWQQRRAAQQLRWHLLQS
jgi:hypothetical protein